MRRKPGPVFLERRTYRRRRMADAARLLPVLGMILFGVPLLWGGDPEHMTRTTRVMLYLFLVWAGLAGLAALISHKLDRDAGKGPRAELPERDDP